MYLSTTTSYNTAHTGMSNVNRVILSLGSNLDSDMNIECADMELQAHFVSIYFSEPVYTNPIGGSEDTPPFLNQIAIGYTTEDPENLRDLFKEIEQLLGRNAQDDEELRIPIDIDLLQWNNQNFKPEDMRRDYVLAGIRSLLNQGV